MESEGENFLTPTGFHTGIFVGGEDLRAEYFFAWHTPLFLHHILSTKVFLPEPTQEYFLKDFEYIPTGIASVERSFSAMKLIKTRLCSGITDGNLGQFMRISIKGPALPAVYFSEVFS